MRGLLKCWIAVKEGAAVHSTCWVRPDAAGGNSVPQQEVLHESKSLPCCTMCTRHAEMQAEQDLTHMRPLSISSLCTMPNAAFAKNQNTTEPVLTALLQALCSKHSCAIACHLNSWLVLAGVCWPRQKCLRALQSITSNI